MSGILYLVPTPIGNLGDISQRMAEALEQADFIAAEDTRVSVKLLNHLGLKKQMVSYYRHNTETSGPAILERLLAGESCALVTDAGMPAISDPGEELVALCAAHGVTVTPAQEETPVEPAEVYYLSQGESFQWYGEEAWVSGYNTTELEDGYMEVSVLLYYPEEREELPEMPELYHSDGISPPLTMDPPDGGDLWRLNFRISTQDTSWLMMEFTDSDDTEYDVILE